MLRIYIGGLGNTFANMCGFTANVCESRIFTEARSRDAFPLETVAVEPLPSTHLSRGVRQRVQRRRAAALRCNSAISSLKSIYQTPSDFSSNSNHTSMLCSQRIHDRMREFQPTHECSAEEAIRALLGSEISYDGESRPDTTVAPFDMSRVALPSLISAPTSALDMLDGEGAEIVRGFDKELLLSREDYLARIEFEGVQSPDTDPKLSKDLHSYRAFVTEFFHQHIVSFSEDICCECGLFFVLEKDGSLCMITDCRPANQYLKRCSHSPMGRHSMGPFVC